jgi:hypothetical protein
MLHHLKSLSSDIFRLLLKMPIGLVESEPSTIYIRLTEELAGHCDLKINVDGKVARGRSTQFDPMRQRVLGVRVERHIAVLVRNVVEEEVEGLWVLEEGVDVEHLKPGDCEGLC